MAPGGCHVIGEKGGKKKGMSKVSEVATGRQATARHIVEPQQRQGVVSEHAMELCGLCQRIVMLAKVYNMRSHITTPVPTSWFPL